MHTSAELRWKAEQIQALQWAVWLFGMAALFATGLWWPGIMFVIGASSMIDGLVRGRGWAAFQGSLWTFGIGVWAFFHFHLWVLFVIMGLSVLLGAFVRPPAFAKPKPAPGHDPWLE